MLRKKWNVSPFSLYWKMFDQRLLRSNNPSILILTRWKIKAQYKIYGCFYLDCLRSKTFDRKKIVIFFLQLFLIILKKEFYLLISVKIEIEIESILIILFYSYRTGQRAFTMVLEIPLRVGILFNFLKIERMYSLWTWFEI